MKTAKAEIEARLLGSDVGIKKGEIFIGGRKTVQSANYVKGQESHWNMCCANIKS